MSVEQVLSAPTGRRGRTAAGSPGRVADRSFRRVTLVAGLLVLVVLGLIAVSTTNEAWPWFQAEGLRSVTTDRWDPAHQDFGALGLIYGTVVVSVIGLLLAVPVSIGIALFVTEIAPRRLRKGIVYTIDLLAAVPSVVFGLWALYQLSPRLADGFRWLDGATDGIPLVEKVFANPSGTGNSFIAAGVVVAVMITPIITSITREVFATVPAAQKEAALALGASRWEMIRGAVFPHSRGGAIAAVIIGLGRAMGETIAVALVIGGAARVTEQLAGPGYTLAGIVANQFGEASGTHRAALIGLGVVLFAVTIVVAMFGRAVAQRSERRLAGA